MIDAANKGDGEGMKTYVALLRGINVLRRKGRNGVK